MHPKCVFPEAGKNCPLKGPDAAMKMLFGPKGSTLGGSSSIVEQSRSPKTVSASVRGMGVAVDHRPPGADVVDVAAVVLAQQIGAAGLADEDRRAADGAEGPEQALARRRPDSGDLFEPVAEPIRRAGHVVHCPTVAGNNPGDPRTLGLDAAIGSVVDYLQTHDLRDVILLSNQKRDGG